MCGRISQYRFKRQYAEAIGWDVGDLRRWQGDINARYNLPPGTGAWAMHRLHEDAENIDGIRWGYQAPKTEGRPAPPFVINARVETAATGRYFRHMFKSGRVIIPADGWFEWTGEKGSKQPWHIRLKTDAPMFLAAITNWKPYLLQDKPTGFVILTAAATGGLVDVHDRRPVVLAPDDARMWMDNSLPIEQADQLARTQSLSPDSFEWFKVTRDVNYAGKNSPDMVVPVE